MPLTKPEKRFGGDAGGGAGGDARSVSGLRDGADSDGMESEAARGRGERGMTCEMRCGGDWIGEREGMPLTKPEKRFGGDAGGGVGGDARAVSGSRGGADSDGMASGAARGC